MSGLSARIDASRMAGAFSDYERFTAKRLERAALLATDKAGKALVRDIRQGFAAAALGRLGQAFKDRSDLARGGVQKRYGADGFSVSSTVYVRSASERTLGAIQSYTEGAAIRPVRGRWLWIATDNVQRLTGSGANRRRLTPALWKANGLEARIGPLVPVRGINGYPMLVVKTGAVPLSGKKNALKGRLKSGRAPKGHVNAEFVVAFIAIPFTSRAARIDLADLVRRQMAALPGLIRAEIGRI